MSSLNPAKNKVKITLLIIIPLIAALALASARFSVAFKERIAIQQLDVILEYIEKVSPVITGLQHERLMTSFYLESRSDDVTELAKQKQQLLDSRKTANVALDDYKAFIAQKDRLSEFPLLIQDIQYIEELLATLDLARSVADKKLKNIPHPDVNNTSKVWPLGTLRVLIESLVTSSKQVVTLTRSFSELSLLANAYQNIISAKSAAILLHDNVVLGINLRVSGSRFGSIIKLTEVEKIHVENFMSFAPEQLTNEFKNNVHDQEFYKYYLEELEKVRRKATAQISIPIDSDINQWLETNDKIGSGYTSTIENVIAEITKTKLIENEQALFDLIRSFLLIIALVIALSTVISIMQKSADELKANARAKADD